jgi:predicted TIM-barrel fold metal-dependent hydrolase
MKMMSAAVAYRMKRWAASRRPIFNMHTNSLHQPTPSLSRRGFLRSAALAALAPAVAGGAQAAGRDYIDAHVHVWTPDIKRYPLAASFSQEEMVPPSFTPAELFAHSRPEGVSRVVLIQMSFYQFDNRYMLDVMAEHRGTFSGVAIVDETKPDVRETMKALAAQGVRGFRLYTMREKAEAWRDSEGMKKMWSYAADAGLAMCLLANPDALPAVQRMCQDYPRTPVVIDHFARIGVKGTVPPEELDQLCRLADFSQTHVKTSAFYALGAKAPPYTDLGPMIRKLRDTYGASRLMWATDCPYQVQKGHTYADSIALIRDRLDFLTADDKEWMLRKTAEKVFFL